MVEKQKGPWRDPDILALTDEELEAHIKAAQSFVSQAQEEIDQLEHEFDSTLADSSRRDEMQNVSGSLSEKRLHLKIATARLRALFEEEKRRSTKKAP